MRLSEADARRLGILQSPGVKARGIARVPAMNGTEKAYATHLDSSRLAGEVLWYAFQPISLRLAADTWYRPDFLVLAADLGLSCVEVKGRAGGRWAAHSGLPFYARDDSWQKVKVAASLYPFAFRVAWPRRGGGWESRDI